MTPTCPICGKPTDKAFRPFCSKRCADVDLSRWMSGVYVLPGVDGEAEGALETGEGAANGASDDNGEDA